jgi:hypothetical protein
MILFFSDKIKNVQSQGIEEITDVRIPTIAEFVAPLQQSVMAFFAPTEQAPTPQTTAETCSYPIRVEDLFPFWLRQTTNDSSKLILMTQKYYDWLSCGVTGNETSFLNLESLIDIETIPDNLLKHQLFTYINAFPVQNIRTPNTPEGNIDPSLVRRFFDNIKVNLYTRKGTEESFKSVLYDLHGISATNVSISYPKRYILRLNGGRFDWMRDDNRTIGEYSSNPASFNPQLVGSYLNHSVIQDNDLWQEFSYVLNVVGLSAGLYQTTVRPLLHPAGTKDFYDVKHDIFNNLYDESRDVTFELPVIGNYAFYTLFSDQSLSGCCGCSGISGGTDPWPSHRFPSWDEQINTKYYTGMTFGQINIGDFVTLTPASGYTYVNETITCTSC